MLQQFYVPGLPRIKPLKRVTPNPEILLLFLVSTSIDCYFHCNRTLILIDWMTGAAGGLGHLCVQYAVAMGLRVIGLDIGGSTAHTRASTDISEPNGTPVNKSQFVLQLGAELYIDVADSTAEFSSVDQVIRCLHILFVNL